MILTFIEISHKFAGNARAPLSREAPAAEASRVHVWTGSPMWECAELNYGNSFLHVGLFFSIYFSPSLLVAVGTVLGDRFRTPYRGGEVKK